MTSDDKLHDCAATGCTLRISHRQLMCPKHWRRVPHHLQQAVYKAYRRVPGGQGRAQLSESYVAAAHAAVAYVAGLGA